LIVILGGFEYDGFFRDAAAGTFPPHATAAADAVGEALGEALGETLGDDLAEGFPFGLLRRRAKARNPKPPTKTAVAMLMARILCLLLRFRSAARRAASLASWRSRDLLLGIREKRAY
jgi:hypothetical protein